MNIKINLVRKFAIFIMLLFLLDGITNIVNHSHYSYLVLGIFKTVICSICIMILFFKKGSSQKL